MADRTDLAALARQFIATLRASGHVPTLTNGNFGFLTGANGRASPEFMLGFDPTPFAELHGKPEYLVAAMEQER